jgi:hypothetical protein
VTFGSGGRRSIHLRSVIRRCPSSRTEPSFPLATRLEQQALSRRTLGTGVSLPYRSSLTPSSLLTLRCVTAAAHPVAYIHRVIRVSFSTLIDPGSSAGV